MQNRSAPVRVRGPCSHESVWANIFNCIYQIFRLDSPLYWQELHVNSYSLSIPIWLQIVARANIFIFTARASPTLSKSGLKSLLSKTHRKRTLLGRGEVWEIPPHPQKTVKSSSSFRVFWMNLRTILAVVKKHYLVAISQAQRIILFVKV